VPRTGASGGTDRRQGLRFNIQRQVRYSTPNGKKGSGTSVDISRKGVMFTTEQLLDVGEFVELSLEWPVWLDQRTPLKLVLRGRVVRSTKDRAAVFVRQHDFRTLGVGGYFAVSS